jgi:AhpC/TSA family protein
MTITLLYADRPPSRVAAVAEGENLWLGAEALTTATGWTLTPDGFRQGERHVRLPHGRAHELTRKGTRPDVPDVNVLGLARLLDQPVLRDEAHGVWCIAEAAPARRAAMQSLRAPDFTLPDLDGRPHSLADYRGRKVFLVSWASW